MEYNITISPGIGESIFKENIINLDLIAQQFTKTLSCINMDNILINISQNSLNLLFGDKENVLIYIIFFIGQTCTLDIPTSEIIEFCASHDFTYNRFLESSKRMIEHAVSYNISINNGDTYFINRNTHGSFIYTNINNLNTGYWGYMSYLFFIYFKAHLAYYIALIYTLITYLFGNIFLINLSSNRFFLYLFLIILQAKPVLATNFELTNKLISALGWFIYINLMAVYDIIFKNIQSRHISQTLFTDGKINFKFLRQRLLLGIIFAFVINTGVLFTNSFYNSTIHFLSLREKIIACISSFTISTTASSSWLYLTKREMLGYSLRVIGLSYVRSLCESFAFNALSYANYIIWGLLPQIFTTYLLTFILGLLCYFLFSFFQMMLETDLNHRLVYGFLYNFVFTFLSMSSSGFYGLMNVTHTDLSLKLVLMILCMIIIILLPLEIYRFSRPSIILGQIDNDRTLVGYLIGRDRANNRIIVHLVSMLYQLVVFFSFAIGTFIWLDLVGLTAQL